jgi:hypothetical protein
MDNTELEKLSYFLKKPTDGRSYLLMPFYNNNKFVQPLIRDKKLLLLNTIELIEGMYLSKDIVDPKNDMHLVLLEMLFQEFSFPDIFRTGNDLGRDLLNFGASIEKHDLIIDDYAVSRKKKGGHSYLISTELEYVFYNVRSMFDLLQTISRKIWERIRLLDPSAKKKDLPPRFSKVVLGNSGHRVLSSREISKKYGMPKSFADFYEKEAAFFRFCRSFRDAISHKGTSPDWIFMFDDGAAVSISQVPFCNFTFWDKSELRSNNLGSIRALISYISKRSIEATDNFCSALKKNIKLYEAIAPGWHVFIRGSHVHHLLDLAETIRNPWLKAKKIKVMP